MKKAVKIFALVLAVAMVIGSFAGCGKKEELTGGSYTFWMPLDSAVAQTMNSLGEHQFFKAVNEATGIDMSFIHPSQGATGSEAFQILLASNEMPDVIAYGWGGTAYSGGPDQAIADGVIIAINDYLEEYAPNYYRYMEGDIGKESGYIYKKSALSDQGNYYGFRGINIGSYGCFDGIYVRKDLLDKWGFDIPETIDDWTAVFKKAKEEGHKYPFTCQKNLLAAFSAKELFNTAYGIGQNFYLEGKKVKFGPYQKEYKDYVKQLAEWMKAGYIDPDYITNDSTVTDAFMMNGTSIATVGFIGSGLGKLLPTVEELKPDWEIAACPMPVLKKGDVPKFQTLMNPTRDSTMAITYACGADNEQRYKEAIKWCDFIYSDEGMILKNFGVEGDTYTMVKGEDGKEHYMYTDKVVKNFKDVGAQNISGGLYHYVLPSNHPGFNDLDDYYQGYYTYQEQKDALNVWNKYIDEAGKNVLPGLSYTGEEAAKIANIQANGKANFQAAVSNIILGKQPIEDLDKAVKALKKAGYDEYLKIQQTAYDRYLAK